MSDDEWGKSIASLASLQKITDIRVAHKAICRRFVEVVLWVLRGGAQWVTPAKHRHGH